MTDDSTPDITTDSTPETEADPATHSASDFQPEPEVDPGLDSGYVLTRRDRTAVMFIDWAVKFGTPDFQQRYRPVTDELFTHHFIDPTAKPAFVPPALASVEELDAESDPLEIIRSHLGLVVDDRRARDKARLDALEHYETTRQELLTLRSHSTDVEAQLADTAERLQRAESQVTSLSRQLEDDISGLHSTHQAELADTSARHASTIAELTAERDATVSELSAQRDATVADLTARNDAEVSAIRQQLETDTGAQRTEHEAEIAGLLAAHEAALASLANDHQNGVDEADARHQSAVAAMETEHRNALEALQTTLAEAVADAAAITVQLNEARLEAGSLTAQRDRAVAASSEWRSRVQTMVAGLAGSASVAEWSSTNASDDRLIDFVEQTLLTLSSELELARATLDEIEDVANAQLVDETETGDYAIGANDAAVLVLNSLYGGSDETDDTEHIGGTESPSESNAGTGSGGGHAPVGSLADGEDADSEEADAEFAKDLSDDVDVEYTSRS